LPEDQSTRASPIPQVSIETLLERATLRDAEVDKERDIMEAVKNKVDENPWEHRTQWTSMFDKCDMNVLVEGYQRPREDAFLRTVWESVTRVLKGRCMDGVKDCNKRGWEILLYWLSSVDATKCESKPFSHTFDAGTLKDYSEIWAGLVMLCLRRSEMPDDHRVPLRTNDEMALTKIRMVWQRGQQEGLDTDDLDDAVLAFSAELTMHDKLRENVGAIQYYSGLMAYQPKTKTFATPDEYTPKLAALQWCMRVILLESTLPTKERSDFYRYHDHESPLDKFRKIHGLWLTQGRDTPFHLIHALMNYGFKAAWWTPGKDHIYIPRDKQVLYYDGQRLEIANWILCVHKLVEELERLTCLLLFISELPDVDFYPIVDDYRMKDMGEYFGTKQEGGKPAARRRMLQRVQARGEYHIWIDDNGIYKIEAILTYEKLVDEWLQVCSIVIVFTCGMAGRGYEMLSIRYYNSRVSVRNITIMDGQMRILTLYHKSLRITDSVKVS
jgi:hypothetical protein